MTDDEVGPAGDRRDLAIFVDACRWLADAYDAEDEPEIQAAMLEIYNLLTTRGWTPSARASLLLRLQDEVLTVELSNLLDSSNDSVG